MVILMGMDDTSLTAGQTAYYTGHALTQGIKLCKVQSVHGGCLQLVGVGFAGYAGKDTFSTIEAAQAKAREMAARALVALEKKRKRLEAIAHDGAKVVT